MKKVSLSAPLICEWVSNIPQTHRLWYVHVHFVDTISLITSVIQQKSCCHEACQIPDVME